MRFTDAYAAWNRLVEVLASDGSTVIAQYQYDGRNFRTVKKTYTSGSLSETRDFYYNGNWQCLEERLESGSVISSYANRQYVWGQRYIDDLILRDRDADNNSGTGNLGITGSGLEERLYTMQDPNWNVAAIANTSGAVQERYSYSAYGTPTFLTSAFATSNPNSSSYSWDTLYTGRQYDVETGLYHYRNRPYGAELGRFPSRDPAGYKADDLNFYRYVRGRPTIMRDPSGLASGCDATTVGRCAAYAFDRPPALGAGDNAPGTGIAIGLIAITAAIASVVDPTEHLDGVEAAVIVAGYDLSVWRSLASNTVSVWSWVDCYQCRCHWFWGAWLYGRYGWDPFWEGYVQCDINQTTWGKQNPTFALGVTFFYGMATPADLISIASDCQNQVSVSDCTKHL